MSTLRLKDFGAIADGVTDNTTALQNLNASALAQQVAGVTHFLILAEAGHYVYQDNTWLFGIRSFELNGYGTTFQNVNPLGGGAFNLGTPYEEGVGEGVDFVEGDLFETAAAGASSITTVTAGDAGNYTVGDRVLITGFARQGDGFPPNVLYFEYKDVTGVNPGTGVVDFSEELLHSYDDRWMDADITPDPPLGPPEFGAPRILDLDRTDYVWPELMILRGFKIIKNPASATDTWRFYGDVVHCEDINVLTCFPSMTNSFTALRCTVRGECFPDKLVKNTTFTDCDLQRSYGDGNSMETGVIDSCRIGINAQSADGIKPSAQSTVFKQCEIYSRTATQFGIVGINVGFSGSYVEFNGCLFKNRSNQLEYVINNNQVLTFTIEEVDGANDDILFVRTAGTFAITHGSFQPGWLIWKNDGTKAGRIREIYQDQTEPTKIRVEADWSDTPVVAETWELKQNQELITTNNRISEGERKQFNSQPLLAERTRTKTVLLTAEDLDFTVGARSFDVLGFIKSIRIMVLTNLSTNPLVVNVDGVSSSVDMTVPGERLMNAQGSSPQTGDTLDNGWAGVFNRNVTISLAGAGALAFPPMVTVTVEVEGFGI